MKYFLVKYTFLFSFIIALLWNTNSFSQEFDVSNYRMLFKFKTIKQHDNTRVLEVSFIARNKKDRKDRIPLYGAEIKFYNLLNNQEVLLGTANTSKEGISQIILPENYNYLKDQEGYINLTARFNGSEALDEEEKNITFKNLNLELELVEIDSIKMVLVKAFTIDSIGVKSSIEEADIIISVQGMLSKMKIEEGTIEDGEFEFEFPTDIPGDVNGEITVYSIIEDSDEFGDIIQKKTVNWGVFDHQVVKTKNTLWSEAAPIWMYVVLAILLIGVWANYFYTIVNIFKIKKEGKNLEVKSE